MKVGDLVNFETKAWVFSHANTKYANPGVVIKLHENMLGGTNTRAVVFWADGKITTEFDSYLHAVGEKNEYS